MSSKRDVVNWFSPLPPERSGIAEFTATLAPHLAERAALRFIAQTVVEGPQALPGSQSLADVTAAVVNHATANFFNIGNNAKFHDGIWSLSAASGGIVILHDARLQHLFGGMFLVNRGDRAGYYALMRETYGITGEAAAHLMAAGRLSTDAVAEAFPLVEAAVRGAAGVIVHSDEALRLVRERTHVPAIKLNLPFDAGPEPINLQQPSPPGGRALRVVAFGHIGPNRRIDAVLRALAEHGHVCHLHLIGDVWNERLLRQVAEDLGIGERLTLHGHVADAILDEELRRADLVVNLRYPTMGEASYSQLRAMKHGVPTVVSHAGWYGELPPGAVVHVTPGNEVVELGAVLKMLDSPDHPLRGVGQRGRRLLVAEHAPAAYVEGALAFAAANARSTRPIAEAVAARIAADVHVLERSGRLMVDAAERAGGFLTAS